MGNERGRSRNLDPTEILCCFIHIGYLHNLDSRTFVRFPLHDVAYPGFINAGELTKVNRPCEQLLPFLQGHNDAHVGTLGLRCIEIFCNIRVFSHLDFAAHSSICRVNRQAVRGKSARKRTMSSLLSLACLALLCHLIQRWILAQNGFAKVQVFHINPPISFITQGSKNMKPQMARILRFLGILDDWRDSDFFSIAPTVSLSL